MRKLRRRQFLGLGLVALPAAAGIDGRFAEPPRLRVTHLDFHPEPTYRFVQFSDLHYKATPTMPSTWSTRSTGSIPISSASPAT